MDFTDDELVQFIAFSARAIDLPIHAESMPAVLDNFRTLAGHAALVMACPLPPGEEVVPVFRP